MPYVSKRHNKTSGDNDAVHSRKPNFLTVNTKISLDC